MSDIDNLIDRLLRYGEYGLSEKTVDEIFEILEKQVPKNPIYNGQYFATNYTCPTCGRLYWEKEYICKYCDSCGQRLDWEE
jgi:predicted RNA-binding Zn-ribbon protein involved in translation (DUF1610 family)